MPCCSWPRHGQANARPQRQVITTRRLSGAVGLSGMAGSVTPNASNSSRRSGIPRATSACFTVAARLADRMRLPSSEPSRSECPATVITTGFPSRNNRAAWSITPSAAGDSAALLTSKRTCSESAPAAGLAGAAAGCAAGGGAELACCAGGGLVAQPAASRTINPEVSERWTCMAAP